jgi:hypothetical protein
LQRCAPKKGVVPVVASRWIRFRATDRAPEAEPTPPPDPEWIENYFRRFETGRPLYAVALSNYPLNDYGFAGGAIAGDASAAGEAIAPLSVLAFL